MLAFGRPKRPTIRNPWTNKQRRQAVSATVLSGLAVLFLTTLIGMVWLLRNAMQSSPSELLLQPLKQKPAEPERRAPMDFRQPHAAQQIPPRHPKQQRQQQRQQGEEPYIPLDEDQVGTVRHTSVEAFREAFEARYGPQVSQILRERALQSFGSVQATADRFLQAVREGRPFRLGFAGYSITVGRGNHYHQSYPFVLYHLLKPLLHHTLALPLEVKNAAIGGIPSFPYGFCLEHFLGAEPPDMVSWDYSMNEQGNTAVLESYIRHAQQAYAHTRPMILALDKHKGRCQLLNSYTQKGLLKDALCVAKASEMIPKSLFENVHDTALPPGLRKWSEFGAGKNCPGRGSWHPKKMEHATIAWTMATYFADALELALEQHREKQQVRRGGEAETAEMSRPVVFPPPLSPDLPENPAAMQSLLYGHPGDDAASEYRMHALSCRTNFEPAADQENLLTTIVTAGLVAEATADDILEKRSDEMYARGWVLDVSQLERETKIKVDKCGGLGYVDMKMAIYGIAQSGPLDLWLPVDDSGHETHGHKSDDDAEALHWIESLVICEANEKRPDTACKLTTDLQYTVGGVAVNSPVPALKGAAEYLKRPTCVAVAIPTDARLTQNANGDWGLPVQFKAASHITRDGGACCLSHVVWEHALHED